MIAPDVGGGFGSKIFLYAEETALIWASKRVSRPIKWTAERSESFLSDAHGRDHVTHAELAIDEDGNFLAMRVHDDREHGRLPVDLRVVRCRPSSMPPCSPASTPRPRSTARSTAVFTNTAPVDAYRGAGRPGGHLRASSDWSSALRAR